LFNGTGAGPSWWDVNSWSVAAGGAPEAGAAISSAILSFFLPVLSLLESPTNVTCTVKRENSELRRCKIEPHNQVSGGNREAKPNRKEKWTAEKNIYKR
jgi:hypothetical protein